MSKELFEVLQKMKLSLLHSEGITLTFKELRLILRYIKEIENELIGD